MDDISQRLESIELRLQNIEQVIEAKLEPLLDLLQAVIKTNLVNSFANANANVRKTPEQENTPPVELMYREQGDNVYISGTKTYNNREIIKATFKGASWDKERTAWSFKKFTDYEKTLTEIFPNIIKDQ
tara:strand:- start:66356 stop:66742 length:387 start_codon:yes stop_codon:yes gene_type:complete